MQPCAAHIIQSRLLCTPRSYKSEVCLGGTITILFENPQVECQYGTVLFGMLFARLSYGLSNSTLSCIISLVLSQYSVAGLRQDQVKINKIEQPVFCAAAMKELGDELSGESVTIICQVGVKTLDHVCCSSTCVLFWHK